MSLRICTGDFMESTGRGTGFSASWMPRMVAERMAASSRDGGVERSPDPVPFIDADILWTNASTDPQHVHVTVHRGSRFLVSSDPNTVVLDDGWSYDVGAAPAAQTPSTSASGVGSRFKTTRTTSSTVAFGRVFRDVPDIVSRVEVGRVEPGESVHFRFRSAVSTPGDWRAGTSPRHEAAARWARLRMWAAPQLTGGL